MERGIALGELPASTAGGRPNLVSPPTSPEESHEAGDYLSSSQSGPGSPMPGQNRKSNFAEGLDEFRK